MMVREVFEYPFPSVVTVVKTIDRWKNRRGQRHTFTFMNSFLSSKRASESETLTHMFVVVFLTATGYNSPEGGH